MGIRTTSKIAGSPSKQNVGDIIKGWQVKRAGNEEQGSGLTRVASDV